MSKNKDNMTQDRWQVIKQIQENRKGKVLYKKPKEVKLPHGVSANPVDIAILQEILNHE